MDKTAMMILIDMLDQHINKHKDYANKFDTGAMVAKNFALALLEKEQRQLEDAWINSLTKGDYNSAKEYYNETYKQQING